MAQGTDEGGAPAETVASRTKSGDGSGVDEGPFLSLVKYPEESTEYEQLSLTLFLDKVETAEQAADVFARLYKTQQSINWLMVDVVVHVDSGYGKGLPSGVAEFAETLREKHGIEISDRFLQELRWLGLQLQELTTNLRARARRLPVTTAIKALRSPNPEVALDYAEKYSRKELEDYLKRERIALADPLMPLELRVFNTWNFSKRTLDQGEGGYEWGGVCGQIVENLLWYYTEPNDLVVDPMAGTGTTIDACRRMKRECKAFDKYQFRDHEDIIENDILNCLPVEEKSAQLVFLDPPYFTLQKNEFESYEQFETLLKTAISRSVDILRIGGYVALILMNICEKNDSPKHALIGDGYRFLASDKRLVFENMIFAPLSTQQRERFEVARAKEERTMLNLARAILVFRRGEE